MPSAFGARDFLLVNARIIIDAMNGIMLYMFCVQPSSAKNGIELAMFANDLNSAKNTAARKMRQRLPLAENHDRKREEARAGYANLKVPARHGRDDIRHAANAAQHAGNQHADVTHLVRR